LKLTLQGDYLRREDFFPFFVVFFAALRVVFFAAFFFVFFAAIKFKLLLFLQNGLTRNHRPLKKEIANELTSIINQKRFHCNILSKKNVDKSKD
jgi:quinol-cytochrome oxidoreductase complex cytochrome b subunit